MTLTTIIWQEKRVLLSGKTDEPREGGVGRERRRGYFGVIDMRSSQCTWRWTLNLRQRGIILPDRRTSAEPPTSIDCRNECIGGIGHLIRLQMTAVCSARASWRCHVIANLRGKYLVSYVDVSGLRFHLDTYSLKPDNNHATLWFWAVLSIAEVA